MDIQDFYLFVFWLLIRPAYLLDVILISRETQYQQAFHKNTRILG
jgi:hypothetical protein